MELLKSLFRVDRGHSSEVSVFLLRLRFQVKIPRQLHIFRGQFDVFHM